MDKIEHIVDMMESRKKYMNTVISSMIGSMNISIFPEKKEQMDKDKKISMSRMHSSNYPTRL